MNSYRLVRQNEKHDLSNQPTVALRDARKIAERNMKCYDLMDSKDRVLATVSPRRVDILAWAKKLFS